MKPRRAFHGRALALALAAALTVVSSARAQSRAVASETKSSLIRYAPGGPQQNGYESVDLRFDYYFTQCVGDLIEVVTDLDMKFFHATGYYWYNGRRFAVPNSMLDAYREVAPDVLTFTASVSGPGTMEKRKLMSRPAATGFCDNYNMTSERSATSIWPRNATRADKKQILDGMSVGNGFVERPLRNPRLERYFAAQATAAPHKDAPPKRTGAQPTGKQPVAGSPSPGGGFKPSTATQTAPSSSGKPDQNVITGTVGGKASSTTGSIEVTAKGARGTGGSKSAGATGKPPAGASGAQAADARVSSGSRTLASQPEQRRVTDEEANAAGAAAAAAAQASWQRNQAAIQSAGEQAGQLAALIMNISAENRAEREAEEQRTFALRERYRARRDSNFARAGNQPQCVDNFAHETHGTMGSISGSLTGRECRLPGNQSAVMYTIQPTRNSDLEAVVIANGFNPKLILKGTQHEVESDAGGHVRAYLTNCPTCYTLIVTSQDYGEVGDFTVVLRQSSAARVDGLSVSPFISFGKLKTANDDQSAGTNGWGTRAAFGLGEYEVFGEYLSDLYAVARGTGLFSDGYFGTKSMTLGIRRYFLDGSELQRVYAEAALGKKDREAESGYEPTGEPDHSGSIVSVGGGWQVFLGRLSGNAGINYVKTSYADPGSLNITGDSGINFRLGLSWYFRHAVNF